MAEFESCDKCKFSIKAPTEEPCSNCVHNAKDNFKPKSYSDIVKEMDDEELAEFLYETEIHGSQGSYTAWLQWLKSKVKE